VQEKVSRKSWAAIQVWASSSSTVSPAVEPDQQPAPRTARSGVVVAAAQQPADAEQRIVAPTAMTGQLLLDSAADLDDRGEPEADDMTWRRAPTPRAAAPGAAPRGVGSGRGVSVSAGPFPFM
jgi:hypothetical protein